MAYLIGQIWVLIAAAAVIGLVLGWLLSEAFRDGRRPPQVDELEARLAAALTQAETSASREEELAASVRRLTDDKASLENQLSMLGNRLREAQAEAEADADAEPEPDPSDDVAAEETEAQAPPAG